MQTRVGKQKVVKVFEIKLETEDPDYVDETWLKYALNDAFAGPEFHEPEGDHPPRLLSVKRRNPAVGVSPASPRLVAE